MTRVPKHLRQQGFTLIEVLLAITITGFVLAGATSLIVSVSNIWTNRQSSHFFGDHVDGVAEFLKASFSEAGKEIALAQSTTTPQPAEGGSDPNQATTTTGDDPLETSFRITDGSNQRGRTSQPSGSSSSSALLRTTETPVGFAKPPGFRAAQDALLNFKLRTQPPIFVHPEGVPPLGIDVFLHFDSQDGLSALWYPLLQEEVEDERDLFRTQISPHVKGLIYVYWDESFERWEDETEPREGEDDQLLQPSYLKLLFEYEGVTAERIIRIPVTSRTALIY